MKGFAQRIKLEDGQPLEDDLIFTGWKSLLGIYSASFCHVRLVVSVGGSLMSTVAIHCFVQQQQSHHLHPISHKTRSHLG